MVPQLLIFLLIILILIADVLLVLGIISAAVILITSLVLGYSMQVVEEKIDEYLHDLLRGKFPEQEIKWVIHTSIDFLQLSKGLLAVLSAIAYVILGTVALLAINLLLAWLVYNYVL
jgi:hypothetical protein